MSGRGFGSWILKISGITEGLPVTDEEKHRYSAALKSLEERRKFVFSHLYGNLDALDNKTNSLIQFSSVIVAIYIAIIGFVDNKREISLSTDVHLVPGFGWLHFPIGLPLVVGALCSFLSTFLFLLIEEVYWSSPNDLSDEEAHVQHLLDIRNRRTIQYRIGWRLSVSSLFLLLLNIYIVAQAT
jgi:hypothetical protein